MRTEPPRLAQFCILVLTVFLPIGLPDGAAANEPVANARVTSATNQLEGVWLADSAMRGDRGFLSWVWTSQFVVKGNSFDISHVYDASKDLHLRGTFSFPRKGNRQAIDLNVDQFDMSATGDPVKYPRCLLQGIYKIDGGHLTICFYPSQDALRPTDFESHRNEIVLRLVRAEPGFKQFPKELTIAVQLQPECMLRGTVVCDALTQAKKSIGWTNVVLYQDGRGLAQCSSRRGTFEFPVPPGHYTLFVYGANVQDQYVHVAVVPGKPVSHLPPISAEASNLSLITDKPAPELREVVGWKGKPLKLSELKGKLVLLDFWGYWCGPCVAEMPTLIKLHERYHDKGLVIIGVHVDIDGEVDTAAKLNEKTAPLKRDHWNGRDLPFTVALMSGKEHSNGEKVQGALADYGIDAYPTTILIDAKGNVVGAFDAHNFDKASSEIDKLLKTKS